MECQRDRQAAADNKNGSQGLPMSVAMLDSVDRVPTSEKSLGSCDLDSAKLELRVVLGVWRLGSGDPQSSLAKTPVRDSSYPDGPT